VLKSSSCNSDSISRAFAQNTHTQKHARTHTHIHTPARPHAETHTLSRTHIR
jgi:hypothetical protein